MSPKPLPVSCGAKKRDSLAVSRCRNSAADTATAARLEGLDDNDDIQAASIWSSMAERILIGTRIASFSLWDLGCADELSRIFFEGWSILEFTSSI
jgi:hypothetical protein